MTEGKMHTMEKGRKITPWKMLENHNWNMIEWKMHTMENDRQEIAHGVHFPFYHFPWCAISILSFSMVCIFHANIFQLQFSSIFWGVIFLPFSMVCIFHSGILPEWKMHTLENDRIESIHHPICQKMYTLENDRNYTT